MLAHLLNPPPLAHSTQYCRFKPGSGMKCEGGLTDFLKDDGSRRLIEMHEEMEEVFPMYDAAGQLMSPSERRFLPAASKCQATFTIEDGCGNSRSCTKQGCGGKVAFAKCRGRQGKCLGSKVGISFPFLKSKSFLLPLPSYELCLNILLMSNTVRSGKRSWSNEW